MSYYNREESGRKDIFLSTAQRQRLYNVVFISDSLDYSDMAQVDMAMGIDDKALLAHLKMGLVNINEEYTWPAQSIMQRKVQLTGNNGLEKLLMEFDKVSYSDKDEEQKKSKENTKVVC